MVIQISSGKEKSYIEVKNTKTSEIRPLRKGLGLFDNSHGTQHNNIFKQEAQHSLRQGETLQQQIN